MKSVFMRLLVITVKTNLPSIGGVAKRGRKKWFHVMDTLTARVVSNTHPSVIHITGGGTSDIDDNLFLRNNALSELYPGIYAP